MRDESDSTDRRPEEYLLFAFAFLGFAAAMSGIIVSSPAVTFFGAAVSLLALAGFLLKSAVLD
jgi:hypothetical protein